jgi:hypothetical protein
MNTKGMMCRTFGSDTRGWPCYEGVHDMRMLRVLQIQTQTLAYLMKCGTHHKMSILAKLLSMKHEVGVHCNFKYSRNGYFSIAYDHFN